MNKYFYPIYKMKLKPWIKYWLLKKLKPENLIEKDNWELGSISGSGATLGENTSATNRIRNIKHIAVKPNTTYELSLVGDYPTSDSNVAFVFEYNSEKIGTKRIPSTWTQTPFTFTTQETTYFVRIVFSTSDLSLGQYAELKEVK